MILQKLVILNDGFFTACCGGVNINLSSFSSPSLSSDVDMPLLIKEESVTTFVAAVIITTAHGSWFLVATGNLKLISLALLLVLL